MAYCSSYYLYQRYEKRGDQDWIPSYPNVYSIDGEGSKPLRARQMYDTDCGWIPDTEPIYRWTEITPTSDPSTYWCDDCSSEYSGQYLTFVARDSGTFSFSGTSSLTIDNSSIQYSTNSGQSWNTLSRGVQSPTISAGQKIMWKGTCSTATGIGIFSSTGRFDVEGNIMSLLYGNNFQNQTTISGDTNEFNRLFFNNTNIINAENLVLPATTLAESCYSYMFQGCSGLTTAPKLPATTMADWCYDGMFNRCESLTTPPALPATTLADYCYSGMFNGCISLTTPPALPATTLADYCYNGMFAYCTSLTTAPVLSATTLASNCYKNMFYCCRSLASAPSLPATTLTKYCYEGMFDGCSGLTTAPVLSATTLEDYCYDRMFMDCTSLTTAPALPATTLAKSCYYRMFYNCTSLTTAPVLSASTLVDNCYSSMFYGCTSLNYIKCLATGTIGSTKTTVWVYGVASSGTFVKNSSSTWQTGINGIPSGWSVQNA